MPAASQGHGQSVNMTKQRLSGCLKGKPGVNSGRRLEKKGTVLNVSGHPAHPYKRPVWRAPQSTTDWGEFLQTLVSTQMLVGVCDGASSRGGQPCRAAEQRL